MSDTKIELPKVGEVVHCTVEFWRHGALSHTEELNAAYLGSNFLGEPMFDIETGDEAAAIVTSWTSISKMQTDTEQPA